MKKYSFVRYYWKTVMVEANSEKEARERINKEYLFDKEDLQGYNDQLMEVYDDDQCEEN